MGLMHKYPEYKKFVKDICHQYGIRIEENKSATKLRHDYSSKLEQMVPKIKAKKQ
jgi:hypothetical protein